MKSKFLFLAFFASILFVSCETEEIDPEVQMNKIHLLTSSTSSNKILSSSAEYSYNEYNQLVGIVSKLADSKWKYKIEYDNQDRITKVYEDDVISRTFSYSTGKIYYTLYYKGEVMSEYVYNLNSDGKVIRSESEGSTYYTTYDWDGDNLVLETMHMNNGSESTIKRTYDENVLNPAFGTFQSFDHPALESLNVPTKVVYSALSDDSKYTLTADEDGYLKKSTNYDDYFGTTTKNYYYKIVEIPVQ